MPFEFAFLDWLYQFRNPVMNTISIFFDYAGAHGEIWIAFTLLLLLFRRTRKAGFAMAVALVLYMAAGHFFLNACMALPNLTALLLLWRQVVEGSRRPAEKRNYVN